MACGDYVPCPRCKTGSMIFGNWVCSRCLEEMDAWVLRQHGYQQESYADFQNSYMKPEPTLNELADDIIGEECPTKKIPREKPLARELYGDMEQLFDELFAPPPQDKRSHTLVVNLFAGPGTGKSTACSGIFFELKNRQINCEIAAEYAKDLVWEKRNATFENQIYLFAKQHHRIFRLLGQVDVVITDCPILLSPVYDAEQRPTFEKLVVEEHKKMWTYNVFLKRKKAYNPKGRLHTEKEAHAIDRAVLDVLDRNGECYEVFDASVEGRDQIVNKILMLLSHNKMFGHPPRREKVKVTLPPKPDGLWDR